MNSFFISFVSKFIFVVDVIAVLIILSGVVWSLIYLVDNKPTNPGYVLGKSLELGLRYLMVGEVLRSITTHSVADLYSLALILIIRIVIVFVNQKEMEHELLQDTQAAKARELKEREA